MTDRLQIRRIWGPQIRSSMLFPVLVVCVTAGWFLSSTWMVSHPSIMFATATPTPAHGGKYNDADERLISEWMDKLEVPTLDPSPVKQTVTKFVTLVQSQKQQTQQQSIEKKSSPKPLDTKSREELEKFKKKWTRFKKQKGKIARKNSEAAEDSTLKTISGKKKTTPEQKKVRNLMLFLEMQIGGGRQQQPLELHRRALEVVDKLGELKGTDYVSSEGEARKLWDALEGISSIFPSRDDVKVKSPATSEVSELPSCAADYLAKIAAERESKGTQKKKEDEDKILYATADMLEEAISSAKILFMEKFDSLLSTSDTFTATFNMKERVEASLIEAEQIFEEMTNVAYDSFLQKIELARQRELELLQESRHSHSEIVSNATSLLLSSEEENVENESSCVKSERLNGLTDVVVESILNGQTRRMKDFGQLLGVRTDSETSSLNTQETSNIPTKQPFNLYQSLDTPALQDALTAVDWAFDLVGGHSPFFDRLVDFVADYGKVCSPQHGSDDVMCTEGSVGDAIARAMANAHLWVSNINDAALEKGFDIGTNSAALMNKLESVPGVQTLFQAWSEASSTSPTSVEPGKVLILEY